MSILDVTIDALAHLICSDDATDMAESRAEHLHLDINNFDGFEPLVGDDESDFILLAKDAADAPIWPMDVRFAIRADDNSEWPVGTWQFRRISPLNIKQWRGKIRHYSPKMVEVSTIVVKPNGDRLRIVCPCAILLGKLVDVAPKVSAGFRLSGGQGAGFSLDPSAFGGAFSSRGTNDWMNNTMRMAHGISLRREYQWSVLLGENRGPRARFITDPIGVRESFKLRDIPPGKERRAALRNWVREHWRKNRRDKGDLILVREHLRGTTSFDWKGLRCDIEPSADDIRRNADLASLKKLSRA